MRNTVLIAHADLERLEQMVHSLGDAGYNCLSAGSGAEALATASQYQPKLAVLHVDLPEVQGTDVCLRLKNENATEQVAVLLVGSESQEERFVGEEVGADGYLAEPFDEQALVEAVRGLFSELVLNAR